ncbi:MAG: hypothetical protein M1819_005643 [Sarea resinae]|nr:MAG: hypothetical protein M1819_005643 [Sarea resinae]
MSSPKPKLPLREKIALVPVIAKFIQPDSFRGLVSSFATNLVTAPFRGPGGARTYWRHVLYSSTKTFQEDATVEQAQYLLTSTDKAYRSFAKSQRLPPVTVDLPDGAKGHWLGDPTAEKVMVWFHGGGYNYPATPGHISFIYSLASYAAQETKHSVSVFMLAYTLAPHAQYPTQLRQAVGMLKYLLEDCERRPEDISLVGDSAGCNLVLALLSHLLHPHPSISALSLPANSPPFATVILISPWVTFSMTSASYTANKGKDVISAVALSHWIPNFLPPSTTSEDAYTSPLALAPAGWWYGLDGLASAMLIIGGGDEVFVDDIRAFGHVLEKSHPRVTSLVTQAEIHEQPVLDRAFGFRKLTQMEGVVRSWFAGGL